MTMSNFNNPRITWVTRAIEWVFLTPVPADEDLCWETLRLDMCPGMPNVKDMAGNSCQGKGIAALGFGYLNGDNTKA